jgi:hypothetical protein
LISRPPSNEWLLTVPPTIKEALMPGRRFTGRDSDSRMIFESTEISVSKESIIHSLAASQLVPEGSAVNEQS